MELGSEASCAGLLPGSPTPAARQAAGLGGPAGPWAAALPSGHCKSGTGAERPSVPRDAVLRL